jgi:hypothetical protein
MKLWENYADFLLASVEDEISKSIRESSNTHKYAYINAASASPAYTVYFLIIS